MQRYDDADKQERLKHALDAWSQIPNISDHISKDLNRGGVSRQVVSANVAGLFGGTDIAKDDDRSEWTIQFDFPDFDKIKKELAEKYKLTPAEEAQNKAVELGKKWGTNPNGKKVTPYTKATEAGEKYAHLLLNDNGEDEFDPSSVLTVQPLTLVPWGSASIKDVVKEFSTKEELKRFLKENDIDVSKDLKEETVVEIIDKFPDFFEDTKLSFTEKEEKRVENRPQLMRNKVFEEFPMEPVKDTIQYIRPLYTKNNASGDIVMEMDVDDTMVRMQSLLDADKEEPKPVKTKMSYKQQQRMRNKNPMWKPN
jgi:hypothetical protein